MNTSWINFEEERKMCLRQIVAAVKKGGNKKC